MLKFNEGKIIYSVHLRRIILDLIEENNYSGECQINIEIPIKKKNFRYKKHW